MYIPGCNAYSISVTHSTNRVTSLPLALIIFKATMMQIESLRFNRFDRLVRITLNLQGAKREEPIGYSVNILPVLFPKIDTLKIGNRSWVYIIYIYIYTAARCVTPMHAAHARNSDQEFLELEFYHDFSRCNPNSHEICMSQIARYIDDRINGRSFSSAYEKLEKEMEARGRDDNTFRADIRAFRRVNNELPVLDIIASPLYFSPPNISTVDFVYVARSYPISVSVFTSSSAVSPRSSAMIYGRDNARERRRCPSRLNVRRRRDVGWRKLLMRRT